MRIENATLALASFVVMACRGPSSTSEGAQAVIDEPRLCTKNESQLTDIMDEVVERPHCVLDSDCPCGMRCSDDGLCIADCISDTSPEAPCGTGLTCDNWGQCVTPGGGGGPPSELPVLAVDPTAVTLDAPTNGVWPTTTVTVSLTAADGSAAQPVEIVVSGSSARPPGCSDSDPGTSCPADGPSELEVACAPNAPFATSCKLSPPWTYTGAGPYRATRSVFVRPRAGATATAWELRLFTDQAASAPQFVTLLRRDPTPIPFAGHYAGFVELAGTAAGAPIRLPVQAFASNGAIVVDDPGHLLAPSGRIRLAPGAPIRTTWLGTTTTDVAVEVAVTTLTSDSHAGTIDGQFTVQLPAWPSPRANGPAPAPLGWHVALHRDGELAGLACASDATCATGTLCDAVLGACLPGPKFTAVSASAPYDNLHVSPLNVSGTSTAVSLGIATAGTTTPDSPERLLCYASTVTPAMMELGGTLLAPSGEISCANGATPQATQLPLLRDSGALDADRHVGDLFQACLSDLAASSTDLASRRCISLGRDYPAFALLAILSVQQDRRAGLLLERYVRDWLTVHAFVAGQARVQTAIGGNAPVDVGPVLDRVGAGLDLTIDSRVAGALALLPPAELANPDHRGSDQPVMYWPGPDINGVATDVEGRANLTTDTVPSLLGSSSAAVSDDRFSRDISATFMASIDRFNGGGGGAIHSPWLNVDFELPIGGFYEVGWMRSTGGSPWNTTTWSGCLAYAAEGHGVAWSWDPVTTKCWVYNKLGSRVAPYGGASTSVRTGYLQDVPDPWPDTADQPTVDDNFDRWGGDFSWFPISTWQQCQSRCLASDHCLAWAFNKASPYCYLKGENIQTSWDRIATPLRVPDSNVISGMSALGHRLESFMREQMDDGTTYLGTDIATVANTTWEACADACRANPACDGWVFQKGARYCRLRNQLSGSQPNDYNISGTRGGIDVSISHRSAMGATVQVHAHLTDDLHIDPTGYTVVRQTDIGRYQLYRRLGTNPNSFDTRSFLYGSSAPLLRPFWTKPDRVIIGRAPGGMGFAALTDIALFDSALDPLEVTAIESRRVSTAPNPVLRGGVAIPSVAGGDQKIGIPVTLVETVEAEQALMASYLDGQAGAITAECEAGGTSTTRDSLLARAGGILRRDAIVVSLADELHQRASEVGCRLDADCATFGTGARCGAPHTSVSIDALAMVRSGTMKTCLGGWWNDNTGICGPEGTGSNTVSAPGPGTATASFTIPHAGDYRVWARIVARDAGSDSFWGRVDGNAWADWELGVYSSAEYDSQWVWRPVMTLTALAAGSHSIAVSVREDGAVLRELRITDDLSATPPDVHDDVCVDAQGAPIHTTTAWDARFADSRKAADATRSALVQSMAAAASCKNPFDIEAADLPLYFKDPVGATSRYFASSDYTMSLAQAAFARADALFTDARNAWVQQVNDVYQRDMSALDDQRRVEQTASGFEQPLADLCGTSLSTPGALLSALATGALDPKSCFVQPTIDCQANFVGPISGATAACYRGQIGEQLVAMQGASLHVDGARQLWNAKQAEYEKQSDMCVYLQGTQDMVNAHYDHLEQLRREKAQWDQVARYVGVAVSLGGAIGSAIVAQPGDDQDKSAAGLFTSIISGGLELVGGYLQDQINAENATYDAESAKRSATKDVMECWAKADEARNAIEGARIDLAEATSAFEGAALKFANLRRQTDALVAAGSVAVQREQNRTVERPQFDFWLADAIQRFQHEFAWAKRLTYMAMLDVEYDFQASIALRRQIIDARTPADLDAALQQLEQIQATYQVNGSRPQQKFIVLSLAGDILKFPGTKTDQTAQLREFIREHAQRITDASGNVIGAGVRFAITPATVPALADRCGERIWSTLASISTDQALTTRPHLRLLANNTFSSQWCSADHPSDAQTAAVRPTRNLFTPTTSSISFVDTPLATAADMDATINTQLSDLLRDGYAEGAVTDLAAHGLYANYVLVFPANETGLDLTQLDDVYLRFDYLSVAH